MRTRLSVFHGMLRHWLRLGGRLIIDVILPPRCPVTGDLVGVQGTVSPAFWTQLNFIQNPMCRHCGLPFATPEPDGTVCGACLADPPSFRCGRSALYYDDAATRLILPFKHGDRTAIAPLLGHWLVQAGQDILHDADVLVPVPLHRWRLLKRRYNQAGELARAVSRQTALPWLSHSLRRVRPTASQGTRNAAQRHDNVRNAFHVPADHLPRLQKKHVVLIDDVYTTGATLNACCKALYTAGVRHISVLTLARVVFASQR